MKIINYGTPLSGEYQSGEDWTLRSPVYPVIFPGGGFSSGVIVAEFDLPTALTQFDYSEGPSSLIWYLPAQILNDNFPEYGTNDDKEEVVLTLPTSTTTTSNSETEQENGEEVTDEDLAGLEVTDRKESRNGSRSTTGGSQAAYTRVTSKSNNGTSCRPERQCGGWWCWIWTPCTTEAGYSYEVENFTPASGVTSQSETSTDITEIDQTVQRTDHTDRDTTRTSNRSQQGSGQEIRIGGTQTQITSRSVPAAIRFGMRMARIAVDPQTLFVSFSYNPQAEVRLTDTTGKIGISCMYGVTVEANSVQAIAPGDRSSPIKLPDVINFKVSAYMAIRTETNFGYFGSAREEARKVSLRDIPATSTASTLILRETYINEGTSTPLTKIKDPTQVATAILGFTNKLKEKLLTSNFGFPIFNKANLIVNKNGQNLEFMVGNQVLTWQDSSLSNSFNIDVIGPTPVFSQSPTPRKSLTFA